MSSKSARTKRRCAIYSDESENDEKRSKQDKEFASVSDTASAAAAFSDVVVSAQISEEENASPCSAVVSSFSVYAPKYFTTVSSEGDAFPFVDVKEVVSALVASIETIESSASYDPTTAVDEDSALTKTASGVTSVGVLAVQTTDIESATTVAESMVQSSFPNSSAGMIVLHVLQDVRLITESRNGMTSLIDDFLRAFYAATLTVLVVHFAT